jgi:glucan biosynthesis protein C
MGGDSDAAAPGTGRRRELEAMRLLVVFGLFLFHSALIFDPTDDYYVKNPETSSVVTYAAALCVVWAMPLLFLVAGMAHGSPCGGGRLGASPGPVYCGWASHWSRARCS